MYVSTTKCFFNNDFNLGDGTSRSILLNEKYVLILFYDDISPFIRASVTYLLIFPILSCKNSFEKECILYLWESDEKVNQWFKIYERLNVIDLLIRRQFSIMILSCNFTISCLSKKGLEWTFLWSKLIILRTFFYNKSTRFNEFLFWPET